MDEKFVCLTCFIFVINYTPISNGQAVDFQANKEEKIIGDIRVGNDGESTYKNIPTNQILGSIQLAIHNTMKNDVISEPDRDLLMPDFVTIEAVVYPKQGTQHTPSHKFQDFTFKTYAPIIFHRFRHFYGIIANEYKESICSFPLRELSNPGASGSLFFITQDDKFIMKTVQWNESRTLRKLLYGYYLNLKENPNTLLPKFFGLYRYQTNLIDMTTNYPTTKIKNTRLVIMNNLLPSNIKLHEKYDLKGSTYKRKASQKELLKSLPTLKDLDFKKKHPDSIYLKPDTYAALFDVLKNDCRVLESIKIMDFSLLMGVHYVDRVEKKDENQSEVQSPNAVEKDALPVRGIDAFSGSGERLLLFVGIIDVLQSYSIIKRAEHDFKATVHDGDTISVHRSDIYVSRFLNFLAKKVFKIYDNSSNQLPTAFEKASLSQRLDDSDLLHINRVDTEEDNLNEHQSKNIEMKLEQNLGDNSETSSEESSEESSVEIKVDSQLKKKEEELERNQVDNKGKKRKLEEIQGKSDETFTEEESSVETKVDLQPKGKEKELESKRVDNERENTNKGNYMERIMGSVQLGIKYAIKYFVFEPNRHLLVSDFRTNLKISFPLEGSDNTSSKHFPNFTFTSYDPIIFHRIRNVYKIMPDEYVKSICSLPLHELSNPGSSGSIFYRTGDDKYFIKTVQQQESRFLQKLLLGYYLNLDQNENTLLPKLYGHYQYQCNLSDYFLTFNPIKNRKNMTLLVMNNLLPSNIEIHEKYDLKGSTSNRKASPNEKLKRKPTFKDLDFKKRHPQGFFLKPDAHSKLLKTLHSDCRVLESFKIMDYSLLLGVHYVDPVKKTEKEPIVQGSHNDVDKENDDLYKKGIPAKSSDGKDLLLFVGIIDILQDYRLKKKLEHTFKSVVEDGNTVSVHRPDFYANRFLDFMNNSVFKKVSSSGNGHSTFGELLKKELD